MYKPEALDVDKVKKELEYIQRQQLEERVREIARIEAYYKGYTEAIRCIKSLLLESSNCELIQPQPPREDEV